MAAKRQIADHDDRNRSGRPIPEKAVHFGDCLGDGETPDKHSNWKECKRCGGRGYIQND